MHRDTLFLRIEMPAPGSERLPHGQVVGCRPASREEEERSVRRSRGEEEKGRHRRRLEDRGDRADNELPQRHDDRPKAGVDLESLAFPGREDGREVGSDSGRARAGHHAADDMQLEGLALQGNP